MELFSIRFYNYFRHELFKLSYIIIRFCFYHDYDYSKRIEKNLFAQFIVRSSNHNITINVSPESNNYNITNRKIEGTK